MNRALKLTACCSVLQISALNSHLTQTPSLRFSFRTLLWPLVGMTKEKAVKEVWENTDQFECYLI